MLLPILFERLSRSAQPPPGATPPPPDVIPFTSGGRTRARTAPTPSSPPLPNQTADAKPDAPKEPKRRALPAPFEYPIPATEYQGYPLVGVPADNTIWPLMKALQGTPAVTPSSTTASASTAGSRRRAT